MLAIAPLRLILVSYISGEIDETSFAVKEEPILVNLYPAFPLKNSHDSEQGWIKMTLKNQQIINFFIKKAHKSRHRFKKQYIYN